jgi:hypothetical protein
MTLARSGVFSGSVNELQRVDVTTNYCYCYCTASPGHCF